MMRPSFGHRRPIDPQGVGPAVFDIFWTPRRQPAPSSVRQGAADCWPDRGGSWPSCSRSPALVSGFASSSIQPDPARD